MSTQHLIINVRGHVQGVNFRRSTQQAARRFGLLGWVLNEPDGSVTIAAQGPTEAIDRLLEWCHAGGPPHATVTSVTHHDAPLATYQSFQIR